MANDTVPLAKAPCKEAARAYWDGVCCLEDMGNEAERIAETAYALSTAEAFDDGARHSFYALGDLLSKLIKKVKDQESRLHSLSGKGS